MTVLASISALFIVALVGCGVFVYMFMLTNGAFGEKVRRRRKRHLGRVSLSQMATIPTSPPAASLYSSKRASMSTHTRALILYCLGIVLSLSVLVVLVLGATQF